MFMDEIRQGWREDHARSRLQHREDQDYENNSLPNPTENEASALGSLAGPLKIFRLARQRFASPSSTNASAARLP